VSKHSKALIIESPGLQRPLPRSVWALTTVLFWAAWFWLWLPLLSIVGWSFGIYSVFDQFVVRWGYIELLRLLPYYLLVIGVSGLALVGWSLLQYHRFHGKERRKAFPIVTRADIAKGLGLTEETTVPWAFARRMVAHHDESGRVSWVEVGEETVNTAQDGDGVYDDEHLMREIPVESLPADQPAKKERVAQPVTEPLTVEYYDSAADKDVANTAPSEIGQESDAIELLATPTTISRFASNAPINGAIDERTELLADANGVSSEKAAVAAMGESTTPAKRLKRRSTGARQKSRRIAL
jgi:biofilm PGA synthesis protein PgaD